MQISPVPALRSTSFAAGAFPAPTRAGPARPATEAGSRSRPIRPHQDVSASGYGKRSRWHPVGKFALLDLHAGAGALELGPGLVGLLLGDLLEHRLGGRVHQVLGLLEAEAR